MHLPWRRRAPLEVVPFRCRLDWPPIEQGKKIPVDCLDSGEVGQRSFDRVRGTSF